MLIYIFAAVFPLIVGEIYTKNFGAYNHLEKRHPKLLKYLIFAALPMFLLIALRGYQIGNDTWVYVRVFRDMGDYTWQDILNENIAPGFARMEKGFLFFAKFIRVFTDNGLVFQIAYASVYFIAVLFFIYHEKANPFLFLFFFATLGTFMFFFTGVRQCLAMCICLFAYQFAKRKKLIRFALLVLLAFFFHKSAAIFAVVPLVLHRKIRFYNIFFYVACVILLVSSLDSAVAQLNDLLGYTTELEETGNGYISFLSMLMIFLFALINLSAKESKDDITAKRLFNTSVLCVAMWAARLFTRTAERPSFYFSFFLFAMLAYAFDYMPKGRNKSLWYLIVIGLCLALFIYKFTNTFASFIPYSFYTEWSPTN